MSDISVKFSRVDSTKFFKTLNKRINDYFKEKKLKKTGNWKLYLKTIVMFSIFLTPYFLILTIDMSQWMQLLLTVVIGIGMAGVGMNVMHDGNHGSLPEMHLTGKYNTMFYTILIRIFKGMMKI